MNLPEELRYSSDHEWIRVDGNRITLGITDYAQDALGDVVFVDVPQVGAAVSAGTSFSEVESTKSVSDMYAPVAGSVATVNDALADNPALVNDDPYGDGWLIDVDVDDIGALDELMDPAAYRELTEG